MMIFCEARRPEVHRYRKLPRNSDNRKVELSGIIKPGGSDEEVDIHGNESPFAVFGPDAVTGDDPMPLPDATFLAQNFPNPFNPQTTIVFGLKTGGFVNLRIYDAAGRLIAVLIDESRPAGQYSAVWNGKDRNGNSAASGIYFYRLTAGTFIETKKMILLK